MALSSFDASLRCSQALARPLMYQLHVLILGMLLGAPQQQPECTILPEQTVIFKFNFLRFSGHGVSEARFLTKASHEWPLSPLLMYRFLLQPHEPGLHCLRIHQCLQLLNAHRTAIGAAQ